MATAYLASDLKHDRKVAIKVLKPELAAVRGSRPSLVLVTNFMHEVRAKVPASP